MNIFKRLSNRYLDKKKFWSIYRNKNNSLKDCREQFYDYLLDKYGDGNYDIYNISKLK